MKPAVNLVNAVSHGNIPAGTVHPERKGFISPFSSCILRKIFLFLFVLCCLQGRGQIVINEVGIGAAGSSYDQGGGGEFIELFNRSGCDQNIGCYVLVYSGTTVGAAGWSVTIPSGTILRSGQYFLIGGNNSNYLFNSGWNNGIINTPRWTNTYGANGKDVADLDLGTANTSGKNIIIGNFVNSGGQISLFKSNGSLATSVSYLTGNVAGSYNVIPNNTSGCSVPSLSNPGNSTVNFNDGGGNFGTYRNGFYLDASSNYLISVNSSPNFPTPGKPNISPIAPASLPLANVGTNNSVCIGSSIQLGTTPVAGNSYAWTSSPAGTTSTSSSFSVSPTSNTTYTLTETDIYGCKTTKSVDVAVNPLPAANAGSNQTITSGGSATIGAALVSGSTYSWTSSPAGFSSTAPNPTVNPTTTTTYTLTETNIYGCTKTNTVTITVNACVAPTINTQPQPQMVCTGSSASFSVTASGDPTLNYQWYKNGNPVGGNSSSFTINPVTSSDAGNYHVVVSNSCGNVTSGTAALSVYTALSAGTHNTTSVTSCLGYNPPTLDFNPANGYVMPSGGRTPYTYQWYVNGVAVSGAIGTTFNAPTPASIGNYSYNAVITDACGQTASTTPKIITIVADPTVSISGAGSVCQNGSITLTANVNGGTGLYDFTWQSSTDGVNNWSTVFSDANKATSNYSASTTTAGTLYYKVILEPNVASCNNSSAAVLVTVNPTPTATAPAAQTHCAGVATSAITLSGTPPGVVFDITGGASIGLTNQTGVTSIPSFTPIAGSATVTITPRANGCSGTPVTYNITVNPKPVGTATAEAICSAAATSITLNSTIPGTTFTWTASVLTAPTGGSLSGFSNCTNSCGNTITQTLTNTGTTNGIVRYTVTPLAGGCAGNSFTVDVTVYPKPNAVASPASPTICSGNSPAITLTGGVSGTTYTWTVAQNNVTGASAGSGSNISQTLTASSGAGGSVTYTIIPSANGCVGTSINVPVTVNTLPTINLNPSDQTVCANNASAVFQATAMGAPSPVITWERSTDGGINWTTLGTGSTTISGGNTISNYNYNPSPSDPDGMLFRAKISNSCGTATTTNAVLNIGKGINFPNQDFNAYRCEGSTTAVFTAKGNGGAGLSGTLTAYWQYGPTVNGPWTDIPGTTQTIDKGTLTTTYTASLSQYGPYFRAVFSNNKCLSFTTAGSIITNATPSVTPVTDKAYCHNQAVSIPLSGTNATSYSWTNSNTAIGLPANGTSNPITFTATNTGNAPISGVITVTPINTVGGVSCSGTPITFNITVNPQPIVTVVNSCIGNGAVTFTQTAGAAGGTWTVSGGGTINASTGVFTPTTAGCFTATYTTPAPGCSGSNSFVVFPAAPALAAPSNTCNSAFVLPAVNAVPGFSVEYNINGSSWASSPAIPATPGCYSIAARYVLPNACGATPALSVGPASCAASNTVNVVIFPDAPSAPVVNPGCGPFTVTAPPAIPGFTAQYSFDDGGSWGANTPSAGENCAGYKIRVRYVIAAPCGSIQAGTEGTGACAASPATTRKVDNTKPVITCPTVPAVCVVSTSNYNIPQLVATDNCSASSALTIAYSITGATTRNGTGTDASGNFNLGISTITWTVTDECGNTSTCTTQVTINPKPTPTIYHN